MSIQLTDAYSPAWNADENRPHGYIKGEGKTITARAKIDTSNPASLVTRAFAQQFSSYAEFTQPIKGPKGSIVATVMLYIEVERFVIPLGLVVPGEDLPAGYDVVFGTKDLLEYPRIAELLKN